MGAQQLQFDRTTVGNQAFRNHLAFSRNSESDPNWGLFSLRRLDWKALVTMDGGGATWSLRPAPLRLQQIFVEIEELLNMPVQRETRQGVEPGGRAHPFGDGGISQKCFQSRR